MGLTELKSTRVALMEMTTRIESKTIGVKKTTAVEMETKMVWSWKSRWSCNE